MTEAASSPPGELDLRREPDRVRYEPTALPEHGVAPVIAALGRSHINGGALIARFRAVDFDEVVAWYAARNRFAMIGFFPQFLGSPGVRAALPELRIPDTLGDDLGFTMSWPGTLSLDGELAATIAGGGAYEDEGYVPVSKVEAKRLGVAFVDALVGDRHDDFRVFRSYQPWAGWFWGSVHDSTDVLIDVANAEITLLTITDTA
ncbi:hypothetical protein [Spirilliplanes yamanashiensis]|uniref:Uncharacterized protein n=1 Tax=Spirilliplanes yamanashiensis TaxID=42233 RepID=A0A8J4DIJ0_9ACTN|nr:hypothetical protein [Spirilliplanes yamanashiensis]MDP9815146.1 hypothetical protein [Spirilliplanes yamanashiensis]GIJ02801.1 hypothetical protein Sya03_21530 [Spirilliplanes yamanashiensis]